MSVNINVIISIIIIAISIIISIVIIINIVIMIIVVICLLNLMMVMNTNSLVSWLIIEPTTLLNLSYSFLPRHMIERQFMMKDVR